MVLYVSSYNAWIHFSSGCNISFYILWNMVASLPEQYDFQKMCTALKKLFPLKM